jgi:putative membrane protein
MNYWNNWNNGGWGVVLWFGLIFLMFSTFGNWGYTYRAHRRLEDFYPNKNAVDHLNERYAKGEIDREEYHRMKAEISEVNRPDFKKDSNSERKSA